MLGLSKNERLEKAIEKREWDKVRKLLDKGAIASAEALQEAAAASDVPLDMFALMFNSGAGNRPEILDTAQILDIAIASKELAKAMFLLEAHVVPAEDTLAYAVHALTPAWVKELLEAGAKPAPDMLLTTVYNKNIDTARLLIGKGVFSTKVMRDYAAEHLDTHWVKLLDDAKRPPTPESLHEVTRWPDIKEAQALIDEGAVPDVKTLSYAISSGRGAEWIAMLVKARGTSVDGMLEDAARANDGTLADTLLNAGVVPSQKALAYVVENKMPIWVKVFIAKGAKPTAEMLEIATYNRDGESGQALLNAGVVPSQKALAYVVENKISQWAQVFIARGAKPTSEMLEIATRNQDAESGNIILNAGIAPSEKALAYAVEKKMSNWVQVFLARGGKPTVAMMDTATYNRDAESGTALLKAGIVPSEKALDYAVQNRLDNGGWAKIFLAQGAKPTSGTLGAAMINKDTALVELILAKGVVPDELTLRYANNSQYAEYRDMLQKAVNDSKAKTPTEAYNEAAAPQQPKTEEAVADEPKQKKLKLVLGKSENDNTAAPAAQQRNEKPAPPPRKIILSRPKNGA